MDSYHDQQIIDSWQQNAGAWAQAIEKQEVRSRVEVTNQAIIQAIIHLNPKTLLDLGCGEGWLMDALKPQKIDCLGVDAVSDFAPLLKRKGLQFQTLTYENFGPNSLNTSFDLIVCNFSLLGQSSVEHVIHTAPQCLNDKGHLLVQTLHPKQHANGHYYDGWRQGSWDGFSKAFVNPAPWYYRTLESWEALFEKAGFSSLRVIEPLYPVTGKPASIIFSARKA